MTCLYGTFFMQHTYFVVIMRERERERERFGHDQYFRLETKPYKV